MRHCCWGGHFFASNVGMLPTEPDGCVLDPRVVLSFPKEGLSRHRKKRLRQLRRELLHACCPNVTNDVAPTVDARTQRR